MDGCSTTNIYCQQRCSGCRYFKVADANIDTYNRCFVIQFFLRVFNRQLNAADVIHIYRRFFSLLYFTVYFIGCKVFAIFASQKEIITIDTISRMSAYTEAASRSLIAEAIAHKEQTIEATIALLREQLIGQLHAKATQVESDYENILTKRKLAMENVAANEEVVLRPIAHADLIHLLVPFSDFSNKLTGKISNAFLPRELLFDMCNKVTAHCSLHFSPTKDIPPLPPTSSSGLEQDSSKQNTEGEISTSSQIINRHRAAKEKFDLICNYSRRAADAIPNTGTFYDEDLCLYLMSKTFKKSATDAYDSLLSLIGGGAESSDKVAVPTAAALCSSPLLCPSSLWLLSFLQNTSELRLGSIGGGPGSDLTGMVSFFHDIITSTSCANPTLRDGITFHLQVFDIMDKNWSAAANSVLSKGFEKYLRKVTEHKAIDRRGATVQSHNSTAEVSHSATSTSSSRQLVQYKHIDLKEPSTLAPLLPDLQQLHFITICWALNEALFVKKFWHTLLTNTPKAYIIIVEGTDDKLDCVCEACRDPLVAREVRYDKFESPRRLIIKPKASEK